MSQNQGAAGDAASVQQEQVITRQPTSLDAADNLAAVIEEHLEYLGSRERVNRVQSAVNAYYRARLSEGRA